MEREETLINLAQWVRCEDRDENNIDVDRYYRCNNEDFCGKHRTSGLVDSLFARTHVGIIVILKIAYFWLVKLTRLQISQMLGLRKSVVGEILEMIKDAVAYDMSTISQGDQMIGGPGIKVGIDESKFAKQKHHRVR